jgi:hypothetical protein
MSFAPLKYINAPQQARPLPPVDCGDHDQRGCTVLMGPARRVDQSPREIQIPGYWNEGEAPPTYLSRLPEPMDMGS